MFSFSVGSPRLSNFCTYFTFTPAKIPVSVVPNDLIIETTPVIKDITATFTNEIVFICITSPTLRTYIAIANTAIKTVETNADLIFLLNLFSFSH